MIGLFVLVLATTGPEPLPPAAPAPAPAAVVPAPAAEPVRAPLVGGFAPMSPRAPELGPVVQAAITHITPQPRAKGRVLVAERQVVAGMNYRLLLKLRDGSRWRVVVWQKLDGTRQVTEATREDR
ncbi:cystatin family protein [Novosphingobium aerophilum]|uniref:Cystatin domain-containing protein n=1 Tax=Novosphingobium aerophilum TaxID=2839843 RepID=A0A7X1F9S5_9SPHN|nr:hypothetical protein [Novosphingobium aerophilum]MBC2653008.1 hypothetical protein [Novosphingobium aerophilum]